MNATEFATIASAIKAAYPNANIMPDKQSKEVWFTMLADLDYQVCLDAIKAHISLNKFPPSIAEIREKCTSITSLPMKDWGDAWEDVLRAIRFKGMYQEEEALKSLDELTAKCVKRLGYQNICTSENITADRANFRMIYEQECINRKNNNQIPSSVRNNIDSITARTVQMLEGGD